MSAQEQWFEVLSSVKVLAPDEDAAIDRVVEMGRTGFEDAKGVFPVGTYKARPCPDPTVRPSERAR